MNWETFGRWIIKYHGWVAAACCLVIFTVGAGISRIETNIDLMKLFDPKARVVLDYQWHEANVGKLVPMELVLRFESSCLAQGRERSDEVWSGYSLLERIEVVREVQQVLATKFGPGGEDVIGPSMSSMTFVAGLPKGVHGTMNILRRTGANSQLERNYEQLQESGYHRIDTTDGAELWRISVRVAAFQDVDYGQFTNRLRKVVDPIIARHNAKLQDESAKNAAPPIVGSTDRQQPMLTAVYTGVVPIVYKAQRALLESLVESSVWSFLTITPLLMFVSRGIRAGAVAMLPNVLPILLIFGGMGWLSFPVDIGSMMAASIALGVAVDDTIHYLTWFRDGLVRTGDRHASILFAYRRCAAPTLQAALINGLGLSVFAFSTFTPTKQFGVLMLTILLAGVVAELILLPALLASPLGIVFCPRRRSRFATCAELSESRTESSSP